MSDEKKPEGLIKRDYLAIERTALANERTFLAYTRSALVLFGSGIGVMHLEMFADIYELGLASAGAAIIVFLFGLWRFLTVKKGIQSYYKS